MKLKRNVGTFDGAARVVAAGALLFAANHGHAAAAGAGVVLLGCAATRFCPLWAMLGIDSGAKEKAYRRAPGPEDRHG